MSVIRSPRGVDSMTMGMTESGRAEDRQEEEGRRREGEEGEEEGAEGARPRRRKKVCIVFGVCGSVGVGVWVGDGAWVSHQCRGDSQLFGQVMLLHLPPRRKKVAPIIYYILCISEFHAPKASRPAAHSSPALLKTHTQAV